ncbi:MAG TPA: 23S rRNA (adenine(2503)-C(2))-methyltransferase RlmN [Treponemataceae bacterium]|nr:23S rRNA (adenine(2503)-C(2))-methyltransferase RlmN [Treponemataceae bacterium]
MNTEKIDIFSMDEDALAEEFVIRYGKGLFHARATLRHLYTEGSLENLPSSRDFFDNPSLADKIRTDFCDALPPIGLSLKENGTIKSTLSLRDGSSIEFVIIPMKEHTTLCVSAQVGCARGCAFCRTAHMGFTRNLSAGEIVAQYMTARFIYKADIQNIVFMGMGEPMDNLESVLSAIDIFTDPRGPGILHKRISISTCGQCKGLETLYRRILEAPKKNYHLITLSISLHALNNSLRDRLMPVNIQWPLEVLKERLLSLPHSRDKDKIYFEYMVIPSVNDSEKDALALSEFIAGIPAKVNLIAFSAPENSPWKSATKAEVDQFWLYLRKLNVPCFNRKSKGQNIQASCGQLATEGVRI